MTMTEHATRQAFHVGHSARELDDDQNIAGLTANHSGSPGIGSARKKFGKNAVADIRQRKNAYEKRMRETIAEQLPSPPVVVRPLLADPTHLSFADFLRLPDTGKLFGMDSDAAAMLSTLVQDRNFCCSAV